MDTHQGPVAYALDGTARYQAVLGATADHRGAVDAFLDKRRPEFTGRE